MNPREFQDLVASLAETPEKLRKLTKGILPDEIKRKPSANEFSILENVWHLRDVELEGYTVRIEKLLTQDDPLLPDLNGSRLAAERNYNEQNLERGLTEFAVAREENIKRISTLPLDQLERSGMFENVGRVTLAELLTMLRDHDNDHLSALADLRGKFPG